MGALKFGKGMAGPDFVKKEITDYVKERSQTHLLVATLIATVTFTVAFTVPGGYHTQGGDEGLAVFGYSNSFIAFLIANTLAFGLSMTSILVHFLASLLGDVASPESAVRNSFICTYLAIIGLLVAFISGTYTVVPHYLGIIVAVILTLFFYISTDHQRVLNVIFFH